MYSTKDLRSVEFTLILVESKKQKQKVRIQSNLTIKHNFLDDKHNDNFNQ